MEEVSAQTEEKKSSKRGWIVAFLILLFLLFSLGAMVVFIRERTTFFGRALGPPTGTGEVALENSYLFASPLSARANGKEKIRVTIFILDTEGMGVFGQPVFLGHDERLEITQIRGVTDNLGRAIFDIASTSANEYFLEARVNNQLLSQRVKIGFR